MLPAARLRVPNAEGAEDENPGEDTCTAAVKGMPGGTVAEMVIDVGGLRARGTLSNVRMVVVPPKSSVSVKLGIVYGNGAAESIEPARENGVPESFKESDPLRTAPNVPLTV